MVSENSGVMQAHVPPCAPEPTLLHSIIYDGSVTPFRLLITWRLRQSMHHVSCPRTALSGKMLSDERRDDQRFIAAVQGAGACFSADIVHPDAGVRGHRRHPQRAKQGLPQRAPG